MSQGKMTISELITAAATHHKIKKHDARDIIKRMLANQNAGNEIPHSDLIALFTYFVDNTKPKTVKSDFQWASLAVAGDKEVRRYLTNIAVDDEYTVGTNGHRIHFVPADRDAGVYNKDGDKLMDPEHNFGTYPNVRRVIPDTRKMGKAVMTKDQILRQPRHQLTTGNKKQYVTEQLEIVSGIKCSATYIKDAVALAADDEQLHVYYDIERPMQGVMIDYPKRKKTFAIVMPMRDQSLPHCRLP